jgi:hypothetical protein
MFSSMIIAFQRIFKCSVWLRIGYAQALRRFHALLARDRDGVKVLWRSRYNTNHRR